MDQIIPVVDKLNDVLTATGDWRLRSPTIVALGTQSSGKSSVIENIVGRDFLPRGRNTVTRCPIELQLVHVAPKLDADLRVVDGSDEEWAEFAHIQPSKKFTNFEEVRHEISRQMERLAGKNLGIVPHPVGLTIYSPRVPDLFLVDLPGMVKTPQGDQPADIERQIQNIWLSYITKPDCIILAVTAATVDIVADDALKIALDVDPEGDRTIGVLTKVDLMDKGTDARDVLAGRVVYLKRGFVPIVARSHQDQIDNLAIERSLAREALFFERHPAYRSISSRCGTRYLVNVLSHMLLSAIKGWLPKVRTEVSLMLQYAEQQLRDLGPSVDSIDLGEAGQTVLRLLNRYAANYSDMLDGRLHADASDDLLTQVLFGGARIQEHIRSRFFKAVEDWMNSFVYNAHTTLPSAEILMALRNSSGPRPTLFIPEQAFLALARRQVKSLKEQGRRFVQYVYDELRRMSDQCQPPELRRFGDLRERAVEVVHDLLKRAYTPTLQQVDNIIDFELSHINTLHPDFVGAEGAQHAVKAGIDKHLFYRPGVPFDVVYESGDEDDGLDADEAEASDDEDDPASEGGRAASVDQSTGVPPDVEWAVQQLGGVLPDSGEEVGLQGKRNRRSRGHSAHDTPVTGTSTPLHPKGSRMFSDGVAEHEDIPDPRINDSIKDVSDRFRSHIVADIAGHGPDDPLPVGAVRVGGKHSPFVAQPVVQHAGIAGDGGSTFAGMSGSSAVKASPVKRKGMFGSPLPPASALDSTGYGLHDGLAAKQQITSAGTEYVHYNVTQLPSRPLPAFITPADLKPTAKEKFEIRVIRFLLYSYLQIVRKSYQDMIPKVVMSMLVNKSKENIASDLVHRLYAVITGPEALLRETDDVAAKRRTLDEQVRLYRRALDVLGEVRDAASKPRDIPGPTFSAPASLADAPTQAHAHAYASHSLSSPAPRHPSERTLYATTESPERGVSIPSVNSSPPALHPQLTAPRVAVEPAGALGYPPQPYAAHNVPAPSPPTYWPPMMYPYPPQAHGPAQPQPMYFMPAPQTQHQQAFMMPNGAGQMVMMMPQMPFAYPPTADSHPTSLITTAIPPAPVASAVVSTTPVTSVVVSPTPVTSVVVSPTPAAATATAVVNSPTNNTQVQAQTAVVNVANDAATSASE